MQTGISPSVTPCLPMAAGRYYFVPNSTSTTTAATLGVGTMRVIPCYIPQCVAVTKIGAEVTSGGDAGSKVRLGIYAADPRTMRPGALVVDAGVIAGDSATVQELTVTGVSIGPGWYWFAAAVQIVTVTQPTMRTLASGSAVPPIDSLTTTPSANQTLWGYQQSSVTGALPASFSGSGGSAAMARIFIKT